MAAFQKLLEGRRCLLVSVGTCCLSPGTHRSARRDAGQPSALPFAWRFPQSWAGDTGTNLRHEVPGPVASLCGDGGGWGPGTLSRTLLAVAGGAKQSWELRLYGQDGEGKLASAGWVGTTARATCAGKGLSVGLCSRVPPPAAARHSAPCSPACPACSRYRAFPPVAAEGACPCPGGAEGGGQVHGPELRMRSSRV